MKISMTKFQLFPFVILVMTFCSSLDVFACEASCDSWYQTSWTCTVCPPANLTAAPAPPPAPTFDNTGNYCTAGMNCPGDNTFVPAPPKRSRSNSNTAPSATVTATVDQIETTPSDLGNLQLQEQPVDQSMSNPTLNLQPAQAPAVQAQAPQAQAPSSDNSNSNNNDNGAKDCRNSYNAAMVDCGANGQAGKLAAGMQMNAGVMPSNGVNAACSAMQQQSLQAMGGSSGVYESCTSSITKCLDDCNDNSDNQDMNRRRDCTALQGKNKGGFEQALAQSLQGLLSAEQCKQMTQNTAAGNCTGNNANTFLCNPGTFCQMNRSAPQCGGINAVCGNPATAAGNPLCATGNTNAGLNTSLPNSDLAASGGDSQGSGYAGYQAGQHPPTGGGGSADGGGSGGGGSAGAYPGGNSAAGGSGSGKSIDSGNSFGVGGTGSGSVVLGNPTAEDKGGHRHFSEGDTLDLSQFLPNGLEAQRNLASEMEMARKGITGANDLSNFEKITRMMNMKRKVLIP